jgi:FSR family fosmidomycin resistance protein-like MFS transporter
MAIAERNGVSAENTATAWLVIWGVSLCHMLNDVLQSLLTAIYPILHEEFLLSFAQIGLLTFAFQVTASVLQPAVGMATDRRPFPQSLALGMSLSLVGLLLLATADSYGFLLAGAVLIGSGSAVFHPEASRVARLASGGRYGTAQSLFQLGGNGGTAIGPLLAAFIVVPYGRPSVALFSVVALAGIVILWRVGLWHARWRRENAGRVAARMARPLARRRVVLALGVLTLLVFSKNFYIASLTSYYTFYLIERFGLSAQDSQLMLFLFLGGTALGVAIGGPFGDRFGPIAVIWVSILGVLPFTLALPHADLFWTGVLSVVIGAVLSAAFPAILVFAQELVPGRVGLVAGIFFGLSFGMGGIAAAVLGLLADARGIEHVYALCAYLPAIGLLTALLPRPGERAGAA